MESYAERRRTLWSIVWVVLWALLTIPMVRTALAAPRPILSCAVVLVTSASLTSAWFVSLRQLRLGRQQSLPIILGLLALGALGTLVALVALDLPDGQLVFFVGIAIALSLDWRVSVVAVALITAWTYFFLGHQTGETLGLAGSGIGCILGRLSIVRNQENRLLQKRTHELEITNERNRMARDLHDILGHSLTAITLKSELAGKLIEANPAAAREQIAEIEQISRTALAEVRTTINNYREISLAAELAQAASLLRDAGVRAELPASIDEVPPELREIFAWVLREGVTNIARHAQATRAWVHFTPGAITVADDGIGPGSGEGTSEGNGLRGLRDRCRAQGVVLTLAPRTGGGTVLTATADATAERTTP